MMDEALRERLSAYHDSELTAAERLEVEQLLASSAAARRELETLQRVSTLMRQTRRPAAPVGLATSVVAAIDSTTPATSTTTARPLTQTTAAWRKWIAGALVAAALLLVAVVFNSGNSEPDPGQSQLAQSGTQPGEAQRTSVTPSGSQNSQDTQVPPVAVAAEGPVEYEYVADLRKSQPGDLIEAIKKTGSHVSVVHLVVVDLQPGLEKLQVLLAEHNIADTGSNKTTNPQTHVAVLVKATDPELADVLRRLKFQQDFVAAAVESTTNNSELGKLADTKLPKAGQVAVSDPTELQKLGVHPAQPQEIARRLPPPGTRIRAPGTLPANTQGDNDGQKVPERKVLFVLTEGQISQ